MYFGTSSRAYNQALGSGIETGGANSYTVTGLQSGQQYYFSVTAVDAQGHESVYSNEATKAIQ